MPAGSGRFRVGLLGPTLEVGAGDNHLVSIYAVAKKNCASAPYCVANEVLCGEIGRLIGLPIPPAGIVHSPKGNELLFASLDFNLTGNALPPTNTTKCVQALPELSTGVLLFDILIANADRHGRNLSVDFLSKPASMNVFDHGHALFGSVAGQGSARLQRLRDRLGISAGSKTAGNRHCLIDQITTDAHFDHWIERIMLIPDYVVEDLCAELPTLGLSKVEAASACDFIKHRRNQLRTIIEGNRSEFTGIRSWRLKLT